MSVTINHLSHTLARVSIHREHNIKGLHIYRFVLVQCPFHQFRYRREPDPARQEQVHRFLIGGIERVPPDRRQTRAADKGTSLDPAARM